MRAVGIMVHGGPEALEVVEFPEVHAGPGQVRMRIYAAAVNPTDTLARNGSRAEQQKVGIVSRPLFFEDIGLTI